MALDIVVIDAGARYGLHPSWRSLEALARFHLFETDQDEVARLKKKYAQRANITVHLLALFSRETELNFIVRQHRALNSIYEANQSLLSRESYKVEEHETIGRYQVAARTVDGMFHDADVHFLKLDTEGSELDILTGAERALSRTILGVRAEVTFAPILSNAPSFGDVHAFMLDKRFELLNLDYDGRGSARSPFTRTDRYGKLVSSDAVWVVPTGDVLAGRCGEPAEAAIRLAQFMMLNSATDAALELLLKAVEARSASLRSFDGEPIFDDLRKRVALLFKDISYIPSMDEASIRDAYKTIFGRDFPRLNEFYESEMFSNES